MMAVMLSRKQKATLAEEARRKDLEREFKTKHLGLIGVFAWILCIHAVGIYFFTKGFLLTRMVLESKSSCEVLPFGDPESSSSMGSTERLSTSASIQGCWHPKSFDKAIIIIIDALRYDFTIPFASRSESAMAHLFHDNIPVLYETAVDDPTRAFLLPFIADPPTTTLQRLKGLTTGTLPTFVDAGSNFAGSAIDEDNLVAQLHAAGKTLVHLGDDTWQSLFPGYFDPELTRPFDSFNVRDLHTVDNGVNAHLFPLLHPQNTTKWDIIFGHYLGVDHAGHRYGPNHPGMASKLRQMDQVIRDLIAALDNDTLLVIMGDHGMDAKGDHGGESDDEIEAALWMYSKRGIFGRTKPEYALPPHDAKTRAVPQIDLVPTLSLLLGMPIPFNNLGSPIEEAFVGPQGDDVENLIAVNRLTAAQVKRYQREYAIVKGGSEDKDKQMAESLLLYATAENEWRKMQSELQASWKVAPLKAQRVYDLYKDYERHTLQVCRRLWASFDVPSMLQGIGLLFAGLVLLVVYARCFRGNRTEITTRLLSRVGVSSIIGAGLGAIPPVAGLTDGSVVESAAFVAAVGSILGASTLLVERWKSLSSPLPNSLWGWLAVFFTVSQSIGFASNSYTIWEDEILLFFLATFGLLAGISSMRQKTTSDRVLGVYHSILFVLLTRLASLSRLCRDEQMPFCGTTYYASTTTSATPTTSSESPTLSSNTWHLIIPYLAAIFLPAIVRSFYTGSKSYEGAATLWIGIAFRLGLFITAIFGTVDAADDGDWFSTATMAKETLKSTRVSLAQLVLALAFGAGTTAYMHCKPCVTINVSKDASAPAPAAAPAATQGQQQSAPAGRTTVTILGFGNIYGTRFFFLVINVCLAVFLMQNPIGQGVVALQLWQILSLLEILDTNGLTSSSSSSSSSTGGDDDSNTVSDDDNDDRGGGSSAIGPIILAMLGSFYFFKTGHQATLSSIQWKSAFIPLSTIKYPWSPMLVVLNTFGAQILTATAVPLVVLWKRQFRTAKPTSSQSSSTKAEAESSSSSSSRDSTTTTTTTPSSPWSALLSSISQAATTYNLYFATINLFTTLWAAHLRRHLMLYRVFCPRFMMGAAVLGVVDVVVMLVALGVGVRWMALSVVEVFGW